MKALVKDIDGIGLTLREVEKPTIRANEVLIKIKSTAICGTDLHIWNWDTWASSTIKTPMTVGHEFMGEIEEIGENVESLSVGMRVSAEGHIAGSNSRNGEDSTYTKRLCGECRSRHNNVTKRKNTKVCSR